jgi:hypothetical protein
MRLTTMTAGLLISGLGVVLPAQTRAADVRVGVGIEFANHYRSGGGPWRHGYARGADEGFKEGERDARRHQRFDYYDEKSYRDSDRGYKGWMGPRHVYERAYRQGYEEGYARAYRRFARHGGWDRDGRYNGYDRDDRYDRGW